MVPIKGKSLTFRSIGIDLSLLPKTVGSLRKLKKLLNKLTLALRWTNSFDRFWVWVFVITIAVVNFLRLKQHLVCSYNKQRILALIYCVCIKLNPLHIERLQVFLFQGNLSTFLERFTPIFTPEIKEKFANLWRKLETRFYGIRRNI